MNISFSSQARHAARGEWGHFPPPHSKSCTTNFQVIKVFNVLARETLQCKSTQLLKEPILLQFLVEPDQSNVVYQLPMINQTCTV